MKKESLQLDNIDMKENNLKISQAIILILIYIGANVISVLPIFFLNVQITNESIYKYTALFNILAQFIAIVFVLLYIKKAKINIFNRKRLSMKWKYPVIAIQALLTLTLPSIILSIFNNVDSSGAVTTTNQDTLAKVTENTNVIALFFMVVIFAPIIEEILFRGIPLLLKSKQDSKNAKIWLLVRLMISAIIFGSLHSPSNLIELFAYSSSGFVLGLSVIYTNRLETSIGIHALNNLIGFIGLLSL